MPDRDSKTEPATPRRLSEARRKGQIAKSQDLSVAFLMVAVFSALFFFGASSVQSIGELMRGYLGEIGDLERLDQAAVLARVAKIVPEILWIVAPLVAVVFAFVLLANLLQVGFLLTGEPLQPDLKKLNPFTGFARLVSLKSLTKVLFGVLKVAVIGGVLVWTLWEELAGSGADEVLALLTAEELLPTAAIDYALRVILVLGLRGTIALIVLALLDYLYQRWQHERDLRMTKQEVKEEMQQLEGDPKQKGRRRKVQQEILRQSMLHEVPRADVVISNPTHYAIAVRYDREEMTAPRCVAKGRDYTARRIRELAMEHRVPVVQRPPLARALFAVVGVGEEIPQEFYRAVAEVLAYVYKLSGRRPEAMSSGTP